MSTPNGTARALRIIEILASRYYDGLSNKEIATTLKTSAANASRDMHALAEIGWARKLESGRWSLTSKPLQIMQAYSTHAQNIQSRMAETTHNIMAGAARIADSGKQEA